MQCIVLADICVETNENAAQTKTFIPLQAKQVGR